MLSRHSAHGGPRLRIFLGPVEIAGFYAGMERGLLDLGVEARLVTTGLPHRFSYGQATRNPWPCRLEAALSRTRRSRIALAPVILLLRLWLILWAAVRFDVFVFGFGRSLLPGNLDMAFFKALGKRQVAYLGHGSEIRPPEMDCLGDCARFSEADVRRIRKESARRARRASRIERWANVVVSYPLIAHYLRKPVVNSMIIGLPVVRNPDASVPTVRAASRTGRLVVVHAPSNPSVKGSSIIRAELERIATRRKDVELVFLTEEPNAAVKSQLCRADLVVDQLWSDGPMPGLASEAAAVGVPAVVGGYGWEALAQYRPPSEWPPSFTTTPEQLGNVISLALDRADLRHTTGQAAQTFVMEQWNSTAVAARLLLVVDGTYPSDWLVDPLSIDYSSGAGSSKAALTALSVAMSSPAD